MRGPQCDGLSKDNLVKLYVEDDAASLESVAAEIGSSAETVRRWLRRYNLPIKPKFRYGPKASDKLKDRGWLAEQLETMSSIEIASMLNCSPATVTYWTHKYELVEIDIDKSTRSKNAHKKRWPNGRNGEKAANWRGGKRTLKTGYVYIHKPDHPNATKSGCVMQHRLLMEEELGRYLESDEVVHHLNGDKSDNRIENLAVLKRGQHVSNHFHASHEVLGQRERIEELEAEVEQLKKQIAQLKTQV